MTPFEIYVAPARGRARVWQTAVGICLIGVIYTVFLAIFIEATYPLWNLSNPRPLGTIILLLSFVGMMLGVVLVTQYLHRRAPMTLLGNMSDVIRDFGKVAFAMAIMIAITLVFWAMEFDGTPKVPLLTWVLFLPFSLAAVAVQTLAEEMVFRGYLQQQLAARFRSPLIWMILPSVLFGFLHFDPEVSGPNLWWIVLATGLFGLAAADLTARTGNLGAAWGFHFANNVAALLILGTEGSLTGLALYVTPYSVDDPITTSIIILDIVTIGVTWLLARLFLRV